mgnify:CR=1 FL=1
MTNFNFYCEAGICNHKSCREVDTIEYIKTLTADYLWWVKYEPKTDEERALKIQGVKWFKKTIEYWKDYLNKTF